MTTFAVGVGHHVEEEGLHVVVQGLVVEEELGQQAQLLTVLLVLPAVDLPNAEIVLPVHLVSGRVPPDALVSVSRGPGGALLVRQTELADEEARDPGRRPGVRRLVPHLHHVFTHHYEPSASICDYFTEFFFYLDGGQGLGLPEQSQIVIGSEALQYRFPFFRQLIVARRCQLLV